MAPKKIQAKDGKLTVTWTENEVTSFTYKFLRDECPCAGCKGETILFKTYKPSTRKIFTPEMYLLAGAQQVGGYALQLSWKDGHDTGLYSWEYLRSLKEADETGEGIEHKPLL